MLYGAVKPGDIVAIVGVGPVGMAALLTAQFFSPSKLIVIDVDGSRLSMEGIPQTFNNVPIKADEKFGNLMRN